MVVYPDFNKTVNEHVLHTVPQAPNAVSILAWERFVVSIPAAFPGR